MAKYEITYRCGHTGIEQRYGKLADRESYMEWATTNKDCPDCYAKNREAERQTERQQAVIANQGLIALIGSEKQIAWAETIRASMLKGSADIAARAAEQMESDNPDRRRAGEFAIEIITQLCNEARATWWISNRESTLQDEIRKAYKAAVAPVGA
jgi:hypothetical protein